jgi:deoxyribodipyrimidine photolyase
MTGKDFEFLITPADLSIKPEDFDSLMTPDSLPWTKASKKDRTWYQVGKDEFSYSLEERGIQMIFNAGMKFEKARKIVEEVETKLKAYSGKEIEILFIPTDND